MDKHFMNGCVPPLNLLFALLFFLRSQKIVYLFHAFKNMDGVVRKWVILQMSVNRQFGQ